MNKLNNPMESADVMAGISEKPEKKKEEDVSGSVEAETPQIEDVAEQDVSTEEIPQMELPEETIEEETTPEKGLPEEHLETVRDSMERSFRYINEIFEETVKPLERHHQNMSDEIQGVFNARNLYAFEDPGDPTSQPSIEHFEETRRQFSENQLEEYSHKFPTFEDDLGEIKQKFENLLTSEDIEGLQQAGDQMIQLESEFTELIQKVQRQIMDVRERRKTGMVRNAEYFYEEVIQRSQRAVYALENLMADPYDSVVWHYRRNAQIIYETIEDESRGMERREDAAVDGLDDMRRAFADAGEMFIGAHGFVENEKKQKAAAKE